ncbi:MAG: hypothetical protein IPP71_06935 [Bacteroidetes bacterium]|nr:hypothetical protein [Bacteroidota bacterium]
MSKEVIQQEISDLLEVVKEQQEMVLSYKEVIPQIEIDMLMANIRKLYEQLNKLNKINQVGSSIPPTRQVIPEPDSRFHKTDELIAAIHLNLTEEAKTFTPEAEKEVPVVTPTLPVAETNKAIVTATLVEEVIAVEEKNSTSEPISKHADNFLEATDAPVQKLPVEQVEEPQVTLAKERTKEFTKPANKTANMASLFDDAPTIAEKFQPTKSLRDKISAATEDNSLAVKLQKNPVSDLRKSIGINEKFAFINELFDGDLNSYNEAIDLLNSSNGIQHAIEVLQTNLSEKYNWNGDNDAFLKLRDLVDRRFTA